MWSRLRTLAAAVTLALVPALVGAACHDESDPAEGRDVFAVNAGLGRGMNLGAALEAGAGENWGLVLVDWNFSVIAEAGFDHVRLPVKFSDYAAADAPYTISTEPDPRIDHPDYNNVWEAVDWAVERAEANDLDIIIDVHHYEEIHEDPVGERDRFLAIWNQIGLRYTHAGDHVLFELLNEPSGQLTTDPAVWNSLIAERVGCDSSDQPDPTGAGGAGGTQRHQLSGRPGAAR
jgi:endoglucanase